MTASVTGLATEREILPMGLDSASKGFQKLIKMASSNVAYEVLHSDSDNVNVCRKSVNEHLQLIDQGIASLEESRVSTKCSIHKTFQRRIRFLRLIIIYIYLNRNLYNCIKIYKKVQTIEKKLFKRREAQKFTEF